MDADRGCQQNEEQCEGWHPPILQKGGRSFGIMSVCAIRVLLQLKLAFCFVYEIQFSAIKGKVRTEEHWKSLSLTKVIPVLIEFS